MGTSLAEIAERHPERDFIGIEVHRPGVGNLLRLLAARDLTNVRVICADAVEVLQQSIPDATFDAVYVFFPDPWPKKRHHKRRLIQPEFAALVCRKLRPGGLLHVATDWSDYARHILAVLESTAELANVNGPRVFAPERGERPLTKFEQRGLRLGHGVWDLVYRRTG
jgi:tRNA (guanine-N7-)-methyltransferase